MVRAWQHILESLGYTVVACTSSVEALAVFTATPLAFALVITDQTIDNALTTLAISAEIVNLTRPSVQPQHSVALLSLSLSYYQEMAYRHQIWREITATETVAYNRAVCHLPPVSLPLPWTRLI